MIQLYRIYYEDKRFNEFGTWVDGGRWVVADNDGPLYYRPTIQEAVALLPRQHR